MTTFAVGDPLLVTFDYGKREPQEHRVAKVGRKNAYIEIYGRLVPFDMATGYEVRRADAGGTGFIAYTPAQWVERATRAALVERLRDTHRIGRHGGGAPNQDTDTLQALADVLDLMEIRELRPRVIDALATIVATAGSAEADLI